MKYQVQNLELCQIVEVYNVKFYRNPENNHRMVHYEAKIINESVYIFNVPRKLNCKTIPDPYIGVTKNLNLTRLDQSINSSLKKGFYLINCKPLGLFYNKPFISKSKCKKLEDEINLKLKNKINELKKEQDENLQKIKENLNNRFE